MASGFLLGYSYTVVIAHFVESVYVHLAHAQSASTGCCFDI